MTHQQAILIFIKHSLLLIFLIQNAALAVLGDSDEQLCSTDGFCPNLLWWQEGVIYQIYPRSFFDSTGNGIGDLPGIIEKLDYLQDLGVDALWLSPFHPSPDKDFGYDVSDHKEVDRKHGTLADFDRLLEECHKRGMRIILDLVLNHTSDQHPWFIESASNKANPKHDWFIWSDTIPNNWLSVFGGKGWTWHEGRGQYYYHMFVKEQPDVNWRNPEVRAAQLDVVRFWLERGVDGFRLDVFNVYFKDEQLRNNPVKGPCDWDGVRPYDWQEHIYDFDRPELDSVLIEMRQMLDEYPERYSVGEPLAPTTEKIFQYMGNNKLHAAFQFDFLKSNYSPTQLLNTILDWEKLSEETGLWPNYVLSNHDSTRTATRHANGEDDARTKVMMTLLLTMRGTPFLYNGEEIGQRDISLTRSELLDPVGKRYYPFDLGRDGCRAPIQWDASENAGFNSGKPWLKVHPDYNTRNVAAQQNDPASLYTLTRSLIALRKKYSVLRSGEFIYLSTTEPPASGTSGGCLNLFGAALQWLWDWLVGGLFGLLGVEDSSEKVLAYLRKDQNDTILVVLNFNSNTQSLTLPAGKWDIIFSDSREGEINGGVVDLVSDEVLLLKAK